MSGIEPRCLWDLGAELGEGPVWCAAQERLVFVDIKRRAVHRCAADGQARESWIAPREVGFVQPAAGGGFIAGLQGGLYRFGPDVDRFDKLIDVEPQLPGNRLNDATVDAQGQLWFGTMDNEEAQPTGSLYRLGPSGELQTMDSGIAITNGPAFSPDGRTLYHTDTLHRTVHAFDLADNGGLSNKRLLLTTGGTGWPDGTAVDAAGQLWIALFGGARIERYSARGTLLQTVVLPCDNITKLAFGGPDLRTAFVTTARKGLSAEALALQPLAGGLFGFRVDVPGLRQHSVAPGVWA